MRAIVLGADGQIGRALAKALQRRNAVVLSTTRRTTPHSSSRLRIDLADPDLHETALPEADVAYFCAAMTGFAACRRNRDLAHRVNVAAPSALARRLAAKGTRVVLLSTNAVFNLQTPQVPAATRPSPRTIYGALKAEAEALFAALGTAASILRLTKVLTPELALFTGWIDALCRGGQITAFSDMRVAPIALDDAVAALLAIADDGSGGIYQVSGAKDISYFEAACHLARGAGVAGERVIEQRAADAGIAPEELSISSSLDTSRLAALTGWAPPDPFAVIDSVYKPALQAALRPQQ